MRRPAYLSYVLSALILTVTGCGNNDDNTNADKPSSTMLFGVYMTGSDLESRGGAGTTDLLEMLEGFENLNAAQRDSLGLYVAFGGADKAGWRGVRYASLSCLTEDARNGIFGDAQCYDYVDESANMSTPESLQHFLETLDALGSFDRRMFTFWDHGSAYEGVCYDENFPNDNLTLNEIDTVFKQQAAAFDIVGMDACLMANYAVAQTLHPYADYLLASEELEPGHGWDYSGVLYAAGVQADKDPVAIGTKAVNSYIDSPDHAQSSGKTLSLVDLKALPALTAAFDAFNENRDYTDISLFKPMAYGMLRSRHYAEEPGGFLSQDFGTYLDFLKEANQSVDGTLAALQKSIVYNRHEEDRNGSTGLSLLNPFMNDAVVEEYTKIQTLTDTWKTALTQLDVVMQNDTQAPQITDFDAICTQESETGSCMSITDNTAIKQILFSFFVDSGNDFYLRIGAISFLENIDDDFYFFPGNLVNEVPMINDPKQGKSFLPLFFMEEVSDGGKTYDIFMLNITLNGGPAMMQLALDANNTLVDAEVMPLIGDTVSNSRPLAADDNVSYTIELYDTNGTETGGDLPVGPLRGEDILNYFTVSSYDGVTASVSLTDINNNTANSPVF